METYSALLAICAGNSPVTGEFPTQRPVTRSFDVFFHLRLNKQLNKQSWGWWFETISRPLWRHCNELLSFQSSDAMASQNLVNIDSDNGLSPVRRKAISQTNEYLVSIGPVEINFNEISSKIQ